MTAFDIYEGLRLSGKFPDLTFNIINLQAKYTEFAEIKYHVNNSEYRIRVMDSFHSAEFICQPESDIRSINLCIVNCINETQINNSMISKFKRLLTKIDKLDIHLKNREIDKIILLPIINDYVTKNYNFNYNLCFYIPGLIRNYITIKSSPLIRIVRIRNRNQHNNSLFNTSKETYAKYTICVFIRTLDSNICLTFNYDGNLKTLVLINKSEAFVQFKNDITKIIRKEKLINLMTND